jgi:hypothetical protein
MKTNRLAKHYGKLPAMERFQLIEAARTREDPDEARRLEQSAPRLENGSPHHQPQARALLVMRDLQLLRLVDIAAAYFEALAGLENRQPPKDAEPDDERAAALSLGYVFQMHWAGWHQFCAELKVDPESDWLTLPGYHLLLKRAEIPTANHKMRRSRATGPQPQTSSLLCAMTGSKCWTRGTRKAVSAQKRSKIGKLVAGF